MPRYPLCIVLLAAGCGVADLSSEGAEPDPKDAEPASLTAPPPPLSYVQSGYSIPHWGPINFDHARLSMEMTATLFDGAEVTVHGWEQSGWGRKNLRTFMNAVRDVASTRSRPFFTLVNPTRPAGFSAYADIDQQPRSWRPMGLRSDGRLWEQRPRDLTDNESIICTTGSAVDITNPAATAAMLDSQERVLNRSCTPEEACIGPVHGWFVFEEWRLTESYIPFSEEPYFEDLQPVTPGAPSCLPLKGNWSQYSACINARYPRLRGGWPLQLYIDSNPELSFLVPPKRAIPLFSQAAKNAFVAYAAARGITELDGIPVNKLPADRAEFNDDNATVVLPTWVKFVSPTKTAYWRLWEDWVYDTWAGFITTYAGRLHRAQAGNPGFMGVLYFQLASWYSIRAEASRPVTYTWLDRQGIEHTETTVLRNHPKYKAFNPVTAGVDLGKIIASPHINAFLHETTGAIPEPLPANMTPDEVEWHIMESDTFKTLHLAKGALAKRLVRARGKRFGGFARTDRFDRRGSTGWPTLTPAQYRAAWKRMVDRLQPDMVSTISSVFFFHPSPPTPQQYWPVIPAYYNGQLRCDWSALWCGYLPNSPACNLCSGSVSSDGEK